MAPSYPRRKPDDQTCPHADPRLGHRRREHQGGPDRPAGSAAGSGAPSLRSASMPFEIQRDPEALPSVLRSLATELGHAEGWPHAVTMTAELSQAFRTKREGVAFVLDALARAFPGRSAARVHGGRPVRDAGRGRPPIRWRSPRRTGRRRPRSSPGSSPTASWSTSAPPPPTSFRSKAAGSPRRGRTDPERLLSGELVYTGALRTPAEALAPRGPALGRTRAASRPRGSP